MDEIIIISNPKQRVIKKHSDLEGLDYVASKHTGFEPLGGAGSAQIQSDWNQTDSSRVDFIKNKPIISGGSDDAFTYFLGL